MNLAFYSLFFLGQVSFLTFFYLFPSGRFVPRWTRWCALLYAVYWVAWLSFLGGLASGAPGGLFLLGGGHQEGEVADEGVGGSARENGAITLDAAFSLPCT